MSSSRMIATCQQYVFMAHICSNCGCPVVSKIQIDAESQKTYTFSKDKAEKIAKETAGSAIVHEIVRIEACHETKSVLISKEKKSSMISPGYFCESSISGYDACCPNCYHVEPWQSLLSDKTMDDLTDANFPVVFKNPDIANEWVCDCIHDIISCIYIQRENGLIVNQAIQEVMEMTRRRSILQDRLAGISGIKERKLLIYRMEELKKQKKQLSVLDIKGQKENSNQIKLLEEKLKNIDTEIQKETQILRSEIQEVEDSLRYYQAVAFGCTDEITVKRLGNSLSYHYVPKNTPDHRVNTHG